MPNRTFLDPLIIEYTDGSKYRLVNEFEYEVCPGEIIKVPAGFETDFASIPRGLWNILPPTGKYGKAAVIHDYIYVQGGHVPGVDKVYTKAEADRIFYDAMGVLGVNGFVRWCMWRAVKFGGKGNF